MSTMIRGKRPTRPSVSWWQAGFDEVYNLSGGYTSLERHARGPGLQPPSTFPLLQPEEKSLEGSSEEENELAVQESAGTLSGHGTLVIDVRTPEEFTFGAYPDSVNIPLDALGYRAEEITDKNREIIVYCASGARSAYAARMLRQMGFSDREKRRRTHGHDGEPGLIGGSAQIDLSRGASQNLRDRS